MPSSLLDGQFNQPRRHLLLEFAQLTGHLVTTWISVSGSDWYYRVKLIAACMSILVEWQNIFKLKVKFLWKTKFSWTFSDVCLYYLLVPIRTGWIWTYLVRFGRIWSDSVWFSLIQSDSVGFDRIQSDSVGFGRIRSDSVWFSLIQSDSVGFGQIRSDSVGFSRFFCRIWSDLVRVAPGGRSPITTVNK